MRKFLIIGGIVATGMGAYMIYKRVKTNKFHECTKYKVNGDAVKSTRNTGTETHIASVDDVYAVKTATGCSVKDRHNEAAKVLEDSLSTIFKEGDRDTIATENDESLDETKNALDDLLK